MWLGITIVFLFIALVFAAYSVNCLGKMPAAAEGFQAQTAKKPVPAPRGLLEGEETEQGKAYASTADLPKAPNGYIAADGPTLYSDPKSGNVSAARVNGILEDMRAFNGFELPSLSERSDPSIQMAISTFKGQFQNFLDEAATLNKNPGMKSTFTEKDVEDALANLRYLQKQHRTLENVGLVSARDTKGNEKKEGFSDFQGPEGQGDRATLADLREVMVKLDRELARLARSGTTDPVLTARLELFRQVRQRIESIINDVTAGTMSALDIPILKRDVTRFLPALETGEAGGAAGHGKGGSGKGETLVESIRKWLSGGGGSTSDGSGSLVSLVGREEAERIAQNILNGLSFDLRVSYTGEGAHTQQPSVDAFATQAATVPRGEFESAILDMDTSLQSGRPPSKVGGVAAKLDWRERSKAICENIRKAGLNPDDYGCMRAGAQVGPNYSWRGNAKMVCTRLETNAVAGTAQTMGCPPVEWKGWRT